MWNYAIKARDVDNEAQFYIDNLGAIVIMRDNSSGSQAIPLKMGMTRLIIFEKTCYDDNLHLEG